MLPTPASMPLGNISAITLGFYASASPSALKDQVALINNQISTVPESTNILSLM